MGADNDIELRLADGRSLLHAVRFDQLKTSLPSSFRRLSRSAIANLNDARGYKRAGGGLHLVLQPGRPFAEQS